MSGRALLTAFFWLISAPAFGQAARPGWVADAHTGCKVWTTDARPSESITWSGACQNGLAQGNGDLQVVLNGQPIEHVEGEYRDGKANGYGIATWANGDRYGGGWRDGRMDGRGLLIRANGDHYDGEWRNGQRNGHGVATYANGDRYEGEWRDDLRSGRGTAVLPNGDRYEGDWADNVPDGQGLMVSANGDTHNGLWVKGCFHNGQRIAAFYVDTETCQ